MIFNVENTKGKKVRVYDAVGREITGVRKYNTKTRMVSVYLQTKMRNRTRMVVADAKDKHGVYTEGPLEARYVVEVKVKIPGSRIEVDGVLY